MASKLNCEVACVSSMLSSIHRIEPWACCMAARFSTTFDIKCSCSCSACIFTDNIYSPAVCSLSLNEQSSDLRGIHHPHEHYVTRSKSMLISFQHYPTNPALSSSISPNRNGPCCFANSAAKMYSISPSPQCSIVSAQLFLKVPYVLLSDAVFRRLMSLETL